MGRRWADVIGSHGDADLVGVADLDQAAAEAVAGPGVAAGTDLLTLARATEADAVVDATAPEAHHTITRTALFAGLDVLGEKPLTPTLAQALPLVAAAEVTGRRFVVSQSRRYNPHAFGLREITRALRPAGTLTTDLFKAPRFGGFRDQMPQPLLVDMAIHQFDLARFVLDADPVTVHADSYNPSWSWYHGHACAVAIFEMTGNTRYVFNGSWCAPGLETSWNGAWRLSAQHGSAIWDGDNNPILETPQPVTIAETTDPGHGITGSFAAFVAGLRDGTPIMCEAADNVLSLAMVEAAIQATEIGAQVTIDDVLQRAHKTALATEPHDDIRAVLAGWTSARDALTQLNHGKS